ncbi:class I SAM-dependent methyltransferase [Nonomuraea sp. NPDC059194]|uniref:class I SAM-dependent methyltransferase n=1 Tax=Nonomuraea sp. NPDC059194 TaxID=3346764 RepID=UPI0036798BA8
MPAVPQRLSWAVDTLGVAGDDRLLEIGCGPGVAISMVCDRLTTGRITAIDRSAVAVERARARNTAHVASGRAAVLQTSLEAARFDGERFDKVFAVNVNLFWTRDPAAELALIARLLDRDGELLLFYEPPSADRAAALTGDLTRYLSANGFAPTVVRGGDTLVCVRARIG